MHKRTLFLLSVLFVFLHSGLAQNKKNLRIVSYNVGAFSKYESGNYQTIANMMQEIQADAICLQELDSLTTRTNKVFQLQRFAGLLGWNYLFGKAINYQGGGYGIGLTAKDKIIRKFTLSLPKEDGGEQRCLAVAEFDDYVLASTHLDHKSATAQLNQANLVTQTLKGFYGKSTKPVFLAGDMNARPYQNTMLTLFEDWRMLSLNQPTFSSTNPDRCIDYIMVLKNGVEVDLLGAEVPTNFTTGNVRTASDHLPIYVDVSFSTQSDNASTTEAKVDTNFRLYTQAGNVMLETDIDGLCSIYSLQGEVISRSYFSKKLCLPYTQKGYFVISITGEMTKNIMLKLS